MLPSEGAREEEGNRSKNAICLLLGLSIPFRDKNSGVIVEATLDKATLTILARFYARTFDLALPASEATVPPTTVLVSFSSQGFYPPGEECSHAFAVLRCLFRGFSDAS